MANELDKIKYVNNDGVEGDKSNYRVLDKVDKLEKYSAEDFNQIRDRFNSTIDVINGTNKTLPSNFPTYDDATIKADITTNKNDIATNKNAINTASATVQQQAQMIQANQQQSTTNRNNLDAEGLRIDANEQAIAGNTQNIRIAGHNLTQFKNKAEQDITTNKTAIANLGEGGGGGGGGVASEGNYYLHYELVKDKKIRNLTITFWAGVYHRTWNTKTSAEKKEKGKNFIVEILLFMHKYDCHVLEFSSEFYDANIWDLVDWGTATTLNNSTSFTLEREGGLHELTDDFDETKRLEGSGYAFLKTWYAPNGKQPTSLDPKAIAVFSHEQRGDRDYLDLGDFTRYRIDPRFKQIRSHDGSTEDLHTYLREEITYHHDSAVFRKDQSNLVVSSLGQQVNDPGGNANKWIPAPGLVNIEENDPANPKSILWTALTKRAALQQGIYKIEFTHNFYDISTNGETYVRINVNGTENTDYVKQHWDGQGGTYSQANSGKNFTYSASGYIRVLKDNRVSLEFKIYQPSNNPRGSRFAHGQRYNTQQGRNCSLRIIRLDSGVEIDPNIPGTLPNES